MQRSTVFQEGPRNCPNRIHPPRVQLDGPRIGGHCDHRSLRHQQRTDLLSSKSRGHAGADRRELGIVIALSAAIGRFQSSTALFMFFAYSFLNGLTLSTIFLVYTKASIANTFFVTAGTFAAMSVYGYTTKRDLTSMGSFLMMGLIGIIIASFVNFFFHSPAFYWLITYAGIAIFVGLTAYDAQKIKEMAYAGFAGSEEERKGAIIGALRLYLDFINLFLLLLRIFGRRSD